MLPPTSRVIRNLSAIPAPTLWKNPESNLDQINVTRQELHASIIIASKRKHQSAQNPSAPRSTALNAHRLVSTNHDSQTGSNPGLSGNRCASVQRALVIVRFVTAISNITALPVASTSSRNV